MTTTCRTKDSEAGGGTTFLQRGVATSIGEPCRPPAPPETRDSLAAGDPLALRVAALVQSLSGEAPQVPASGPGASEGRRRHETLLSILTYAYCAGILESRRIYTLLMRDPALRRVCNALEIDDRVLRRFRRQHRERLLQCMSAVLEAPAAGSGRGATPSPPPGSRALVRLHDAILLDQLEET